jgi:hypothetical protein
MERDDLISQKFASIEAFFLAAVRFTESPRTKERNRRRFINGTESAEAVVVTLVFLS